MNIYESKREYHKIQTPDELDTIVEFSIKKGENKKKLWYNEIRLGRIAGVLAAVIMILIAAVSNISREFVMAASDIPVLGNIVKVVTWKDYQEEDDAKIISVKIPKIETGTEDNLENRINNEIRVKINQVLEEAAKRAEEYRDAYIKTGGDAEQWHQMEINVDYEVKCNKNNILSFVVTKSESYASVYTEQFYYNIDLETGKDLTLENLLGPDYIARANEAINSMIEKRVAEGDVFFGYGTNQPSIGKFTTILPDTRFYINDNEKVVIVFEKYEIAPGYMGILEFEIN